MKKRMTLVVAVMLMTALFIGAFTVTSSALTFKDAEDINYKTAVNQMVSDGIIKGYPDGSFCPSKNVTRAEMAKMISYYVSGTDVGGQYAGACTFADSKKHWAAGYIAYCAGNGIIAGRSADKFDGNANVTGIEAAKMLLVTLGKDATANGYIGSSWAFNVVRDAESEGLFKGLVSFNSNDPLMREEAAKMIYNAMKAKGTVSSDEEEITTLHVAPAAVTISKTSMNLNQGQSGTLSATIAPEKASGNKIYWTSNKPEVVTVDGNGKVTATGFGSAYITAYTENGKSASCEVTVYLPNIPELVFSSGAGGWHTLLAINPDGTFKGSYIDYDWSEAYFCNFNGKFTVEKMVDKYTVLLKVSNLNIPPSENKFHKEYSSDIGGYFSYYPSEPYGMEDATYFYLYLPGKDTTYLAEECKDWMNSWRYEGEPRILSEYVLYSNQNGNAFESGSVDQNADGIYVGTWIGTTASYEGIELGVSDILGGDFTITLEADGTATVDVAGDRESGDWEPTDNGIILFDSSDELEFIYQKGKLVICYDGVTMNFEKL